MLGETERIGEIVEAPGERSRERDRVVLYPGSDADVRRACRRRTRKEQS